VRFVLASGNRHKLHEFRSILAPHQVVAMPAGILLPPEGETSFTENALGKALALAQAVTTGAAAAAAVVAGSDRPDYFIGDDSGLEVEALGWRPGVLSSRYAGEDATDADNNAKLLVQLEAEGSFSRRARFVCVLAAVAPDMAETIVRGEWWGVIATSPSGDGGFGYDPVFVPDGDRLTVAELSQEQKDRASHRALAGRALLETLQRQGRGDAGRRRQS